jgi:uncharacterized repeat protein (TIGR02543 family)
MNNYKFLIYNGTQFVDITKLIQTNANIQDKLDLTLDFASFVIKHAKQSYTDIPGIDFSKPLKPWTPVIIDINNGQETYRMYTTNCSRNIIGKGSTKRYSHEISLVEATKSLWGKPIPNFTITQPKSDILGTWFSVNKTNEGSYPQESVTVSNTPIDLSFVTTNESGDTSILEGLTLKDTNEREYNLNINFRVYNEISNFSAGGITYSNADTIFEIKIFRNGILFETITGNIPAGIGQPHNVSPSITIISKNYLITNTISSTFTFEVRTIGFYNFSGGGYNYTIQDTVKINAVITPSTPRDEGLKPKELSSEMEKVLSTVNDIYGTSYYLSETAKANVTGIISPEFTFESYTAWDALERLANYVDAIPEIGEKDFNEVSLRFINEDPDLSYDLSSYTEESQSYVFDDYNTGLEINASNLVEEDVLNNVKVEPYVGGWMTVRVNNPDISQLTEDNSAFKTRQNIYRVYKLFIKGVGVVATGPGSNIVLNGNAGGTDYTNHTYWDLSDFIVEKQRWDTFENGTLNKSPSERREINTKGNNIYFKQGSKYIDGLGYKTQTLSTFLGTTVAPRALMETIMRAAEIYLQELDIDGVLEDYQVQEVTDGNPELAIVDTQNRHKLFRGVLVQVHYIPMANVRSTIYRYDSFDRGIDILKFGNEQDKVNDTVNIGEYIKKTTNKLGNIIYTVSGRAKNYGSIPKLGFKTLDNKYISSRSINLNKNIINYDLELSENFINQSSYVGVDSRYRQFEVPDDSVVHRQDKYNEFILLTTNRFNHLPHTTNFERYGKRMILDGFQNASSTYNRFPISYGKMTITKTIGSTQTDNIQHFDIPINGFAVGTTINLQLEADDNYSMGPRIDELDIASTFKDEFRLQNYTNYTNFDGTFDKFELSLRSRGTVNNTEVDANEYPFNVNDTYSSNDPVLFNLTKDNVFKDAREKYGLNIQLPVLSTDIETIRIFPGFAKYNSIIRHKGGSTIRVALMEDGYIPMINNIKVDTSKIRILDPSDYIADLVYDSTNEAYGLRYREVEIPANTVIQGIVVYEELTEELILSLNEKVDRNGLSGISYDFTTIYSIHKQSLNNYMYPDSPQRFTVTFNSMNGTDVPSQQVLANTAVNEPITSREGFSFNGWYSDISLTQLFDFSTPIVSNITLYAKWISIISGEHQWVRVYTNIVQGQIYPNIDSYTCSSNYINLLPDPNNYDVDFTFNVTPVRLCNPEMEMCLINPETEETFQLCPTHQYRVEVIPE